MQDKVMSVNVSNFKEEVLDSKVPTVVDFWAEWCMPCKMLSPIIDELSTNYSEKVKFVKIDVDDNSELATNLQILSIPVLILFKNGKELKRIVGVNPKEVLQKEIDNAFGGA